MSNNEKNSVNQMNVGGIITRFVTSAIILAVTAFLTPGFEISSFWTLILAAVVLSIIDYLFNMLLGVDATPLSRGIVGFVASVAVLYLTQYFVAGYHIGILSAIVGAIIYGIIASMVPGRQSL